MQQARANWRQEVASWVTWVVAAGLFTDLVHFSIQIPMLIRPAAPSPPYQPAAHPHRFKIDPRQIIGAHLFGVSAPSDAADAADPRVALALSGVIAMDDPTDGYAILGEKGQMRVYRVGSELSGTLAGRLAQVLDDRVILALDGGTETLRLPRELSSMHAPLVQLAMTDAARSDDGARADDAEAAAAAAAAAQAARLARMDSLPSDKQKWLAMVSADPDAVTSQGIAVHPNRHYERQYGLHDGDVVTAINGVSITDANALDDALKSSTGMMSLTFTHEGAAQTVRVPTNP